MTERNCTFNSRRNNGRRSILHKKSDFSWFSLVRMLMLLMCWEFFKGLKLFKIIQVIKPASPYPKVLREQGFSGAQSGHLAVGRAGAQLSVQHCAAITS